MGKLRFVWDYDDFQDLSLSYLEQWDTPEKYYDVKPVCPNCGDHSMTYESEHIFTCDRIEVDGADCDGRFDGNEHSGDSSGVVLEDGKPIPFEEYKQFYGNPNRHVVLTCMLEEACGECGSWVVKDSLCGIDFMDTESVFVGTCGSDGEECSESQRHFMEEMLTECRSGMA